MLALRVPSTTTTMKAILAVVAVLLAVTHLGDTHGDHTHPQPPYREPLVVVCVFVYIFLINFYLHNITGVLAEKPAFAVDSVSAKALCRLCINESTSNVSYVDDGELGC